MRKTECLYDMASRLLNVRLGPDRIRKARRLREAGVSVSEVVRKAINVRFEALDRPLGGREAAARVRRILDAHPDPAGLPARTYDVDDAREARAAARGRRFRSNGVGGVSGRSSLCCVSTQETEPNQQQR
jgi:hypothetical protein